MKELICIICPRGCHLKVFETAEGFKVEGYSCKRGEKYGITEILNPERVLTSTIKVINGKLSRVPVRSSNPIPKNLIFDVMKEINKVIITAPIQINDVIIKNVLNTNSDIIATRTILKNDD